MKIHHILIVIGLCISAIGVMAYTTQPTASSALRSDGEPADMQPTPAPAEVLQATATVSSAVAMPVIHGDSIDHAVPMENIFWQDSFDNIGSGWEPRYEVTRFKDSMNRIIQPHDPRLFAWNGYADGSYQISLPRSQQYRIETSTYLWDFNPNYLFPPYPYRVRADISVNPAGNAMLLLDYSGDFSRIEAGDGLAVVWGHHDGLTYRYVDTWQLVVYEFHGGHTWELGCSTGALSAFNALQSSAVVDVDASAIRVRIFSPSEQIHDVTCARAWTGRPEMPRYVGIGAVHAGPMVPTNDYNTVAFNEISVMAGSPVTPPTAPITEITGGCNGAWMGGYDYEQAIPVTQALQMQTLCRNEYANFSSDFPGYGPVRVAMPPNDLNNSRWSCGGNAPSSQLIFWQGPETLQMTMDNTSYYVFYAKDISEHLRAYPQAFGTISDGYIVTQSPNGGNNTTFQSVDFVNIGDGIGVQDQYRFFFTIENNQLITNWTALPCTRN